MSTFPEWADICIKLLQGPLYNEKGSEAAWNKLITWQQQVAEYFSTLGLELILDSADGYAYLNQDETEDENGRQLPRLIRKMPLTFETSLLCVLLREALENFDYSPIESPTLIMTAGEIRELLTGFYKDRADETKLYRELEQNIARVEDIGFLKRLPQKENSSEGEYEVRRIIRSKIDMEFITEFKNKLEEYNGEE